MWFTVAHCDCGTDTCVGCKENFAGEEHRCNATEPGVKPDLLPNYSATCRIKQCPACYLWIEHKEACNHMTCCYCRYDFCFVCLQIWDGNFHDDEGCPSYGDPPEGCDAEDFEQNARGLYRDTGCNRAGLDRFGHPRPGAELASEDASDDDQDGYNDQDDYDPVEHGLPKDHKDIIHGAELVDWDEHWDNAEIAQVDGQNDADQVDPWQNLDANAEWQEPPADEVFIPAGPEEHDELVVHPPINLVVIEDPHFATIYGTPENPTLEPPAAIRAQLRQIRRVPIFTQSTSGSRTYNHGTPTFQQLDCSQHWSSTGLHSVAYSAATCPICHLSMVNYFYYCTDCGIITCDHCHSGFKWRVASNLSDVLNLLDIIEWAERGEVPYKASRRQGMMSLEEEPDLGIAKMFETHEDELFALQPYQYWDLGIKMMIEELETEMQKED